MIRLASDKNIQSMVQPTKIRKPSKNEAPRLPNSTFRTRGLTRSSPANLSSPALVIPSPSVIIHPPLHASTRPDQKIILEIRRVFLVACRAVPSSDLFVVNQFCARNAPWQLGSHTGEGLFLQEIAASLISCKFATTEEKRSVWHFWSDEWNIW